VFSEYVNTKFENYYSDVNDKLYVEQISYKEEYFRLFVSKIRKYINKDSEVLEIGSFYGVLGSIIAPIVKSYTGVELSKHASEYAIKNYKLNIINQSAEKLFNCDKKYDVILMTDVIEHLDNPFRTIEMIQKNLTKNGFFIFSTLNMDSLTSKILRKKYHWIILMHKFYFSTDVLKKICLNYKLKMIDVINDERIISYKYFLWKINNYFPKWNFIINLMKKLQFLNNIKLKINLYDLKIYVAQNKSEV
jgi:2-polyprenyl-3-methyl-5-hydroxy-6-metoxy-1,4-benzoquinol methylase|tara:strand:- start:153 stop:896 length:744 start_codon:yes stop_codon:yes gene_type:complete